MAETTEPSEATDAPPAEEFEDVQAGLASWQKALLAVTLLPFAAMLLPSLAVLFLGMLPTLAAAAAERVRGRHLAKTVGLMNFCGCLPLLIELWSFGQSFHALSTVMKDVYGWLLAYSAAGFGWAIYLMVPPFVTAYYTVITEAQVRILKQSQRKLVEMWGEEIAETPSPAAPAQNPEST